MHLGRFHAVVQELSSFYQEAALSQKLDTCASSLDSYAQSRAQSHIESFKTGLESFRASATAVPEFLQQPHSVSVVEQLGLSTLLGEALYATVTGIVYGDQSYDHVSVAAELRKLTSSLNSRVASVVALDKSLDDLNVEYEHVADDESELGVLIPRELVGSTLPQFAKELDKFSGLFRAINELTGASSYDPKIRTISTSWWQFFIELDAIQIAAWTAAIERILTMFKNNLEIKKLQQELAKHEFPLTIHEAMEAEIDRRLSDGIQKIAADLRAEFGTGKDAARLNEVETQLRHGLHHLAHRLNQGTQVEINIGIPELSETEPPSDDESDAAREIRQRIADQKAKIQKLRDLREKANAVCTQTLSLDHTEPGLIKYDDPASGHTSKETST